MLRFALAFTLFVMPAAAPVAGSGGPLVEGPPPTGFVRGPAAPAAPGAPAAPQSSPEQMINTAETLFAGGDRTAALQIAERVVATAPFNVEAHHLIQRIYRAEKNRQQLVARYRELATRHPGSPAAQYLLGNALLGVDGSAAARPHFDRALQLDPGFGWAASINAIFNQREGNPEEALRLARLSVQDVGDDVLTATIYADLLRMNGLRTEGIRFLELAAAANPAEPKFLLELWKLRMRGVDDYEAERASFAWQVAANRSRFLDSAEHTAILARFYRGAAMGDSDGSRELWLTLANRFPDDPEAKRALMRAAGLSDDNNAKIELYSRILEAYPDSPIRYHVYYTMLRDLIREGDYGRAQRLARGLTSEPDPGRDGGHPGEFEGATDWGYTLAGIGYAGWFAAAQAEASAGNGSPSYNVRLIGAREQPISPQALTAARALEASSCNDPRALHYVVNFLLDSSYHRELGIRLMQRAMNAARGGDPLTDLAYGADELEAARERLERDLRRMPIYYALAGRTSEAERAAEQMLAALSFDGSPRSAGRLSDAHYVAGKVFDIVGRRREAARHYLASQWYAPTLPRSTADRFLAELAHIYEDVAPTAIERFRPGTGPRMPLMRFGLSPVEGAGAIDGTALGGDLLLVVFWATWNNSSVGQVQALDALTAELGERGLSGLAVAVQRGIGRPGSSSDRFSSFRERNALTIPLARGDLDTIERVGLLGLPTTLLLDAGGRVLARQLSFDVHPDSWTQQWGAIIDEELARKAEPAAVR